jgi:hypothetical protein
MSNITSKILGKPEKPDLPPPPEEIEEVEEIEEDAGQAARRQKKKILSGGRRKTILSGITQALKKRLGE